MPSLTIRGRTIGAGSPCYMIAELSANHGQDYGRAVELMHAAKECGADAVKLQTYTPDTITLKSNLPCFRIEKGLWAGKTLHDLYGEAYTPWDWQPKLQELGEKLGMAVFSTPFDTTAVDFLDSMGTPAFKIASFELVDLPLIRSVAERGKPMIMSTGMATLGEIDDAVKAARGAGAKEIALLKCTSSYPAPPQEANLRGIPYLAEVFGVASGLSDHTLAHTVPVVAVALGASLIEKHFTMSRSEPGPDSAFSLEPREFRDMVTAVRTTEAALGRVTFGPTPADVGSLQFRRSLFVVEDVRKGQAFTTANVRSVRPAAGLAPKHLEDVLRATAREDIPAGTPLAWNLIA